MNQQMRPASASTKAVARPIPLDAPVASAVLLWSVVTLPPLLLLRMALGEEPSKQVVALDPFAIRPSSHSFVVLVRHSFRRPRSGSSP